MMRGVIHNVKGAALTIDVTLNVDADEEDKPSFRVDLCALRRVCQTASYWVVYTRIACPLGRGKFAMSSAVLFISLRDRLSCTEFLDFFTRRRLYGVFVRKR